MDSKRIYGVREYRECIFIRRGSNTVSHEGWLLDVRYGDIKRLYLSYPYHNLTVF